MKKTEEKHTVHKVEIRNGDQEVEYKAREKRKHETRGR